MVHEPPILNLDPHPSPTRAFSSTPLHHAHSRQSMSRGGKAIAPEVNRYVPAPCPAAVAVAVGLHRMQATLHPGVESITNNRVPTELSS